MVCKMFKPETATKGAGMSECEQWRPLALKGICECGDRFWKHRRSVQVDAVILDTVTRLDREIEELQKATGGNQPSEAERAVAPSASEAK